jgi:hypothetical protein
MKDKKKYHRTNIYLDPATKDKLLKLQEMGVKFNKSKFFAEKFVREFRKLKIEYQIREG